MKGTGVDTKSGSIDLRYRTNKLLVSNQLSIDFTVGDRTSPYGTFQTYTMLNPYYRIYDENGAISKVLDNHVYSTDGYVSYIGGYSTPTMNPMYNIQFHQKDQNKQFSGEKLFPGRIYPDRESAYFCRYHLDENRRRSGTVQTVQPYRFRRFSCGRPGVAITGHITKVPIIMSA